MTGRRPGRRNPTNIVWLWPMHMLENGIAP